jgi:hypothetical protein
MISVSLKEICKSTTNRDDGTATVLKLLENLYPQDPTTFGKKMEEESDMVHFRVEWNGVIIDIPEDMVLSASFVDELIYRLDEKEVLGTFVFSIHDDRNYEKFQKVSTNREIEISAIWHGDNVIIFPSEKKTHEDRKIIIRDL